MRQRVLLSSLGALALGAVWLAGPAASDDSDDRSGHHERTDLLRSSVAGSQLDDKPVFGAAPGGAPWVIDRGSIRLDQDGRLRVKVRGLVIPDVGNPVPELSASVACNGEVVDTTAVVPFSPDGDARIRTRVMLPDRCIAPVVMLNPRGIPTVFIGISGREA